VTLYARADLLSAAVPRSHGGCGERHDRPYENGAPDKLWVLDCPQCELELRDSPHWSATISEIPETHDEQIIREDQEKRGQRDAATGTAQALEKLSALGDLPGVLAQLALLLTGQGGQTPQLQTATCPSGHQSLVGTKFCGECGSPMFGELTQTFTMDTTVATQDLLVPATWVEAPEPLSDEVSTEVVDNTDLDALSLTQLREIARTRGVRTARSKAEQLELLQGTQ